jgi:hypothetical protein
LFKLQTIALISGVPVVIMPCQPVVANFNTSIPEMQLYLNGKNQLAELVPPQPGCHYATYYATGSTGSPGCRDFRLPLTANSERNRNAPELETSN